MVMKACHEMESEKMQDATKKRFSSGVKREGAVVQFEGDDDMKEMDDDEAEARKNAREYVQIELEGCIAFGTGEHPTTRMCLDWI